MNWLSGESGPASLDPTQLSGTGVGQVLEIAVQDSQLTGRPAVGRVSVPLSRIPEDGRMTAWLPVQACPCPAAV